MNLQNKESDQPAPPKPVEAAAGEPDLLVNNRWLGIAIFGGFVLAICYTLYFARELLLPIALAMLFALLLQPVMRAFRLLHLPEPAGALIIVLGLLVAIGVGVYLLATPATEWLHKAPASLPKLEQKFSELATPLQRIKKATERVQQAASGATAEPEPGTRKPREVTVKTSLLGSSTLWAGTESFVVSAVATIILLYFLLAAGDLFLRKTVRVIPRFRDKVTAVEVVQEIESEVGRYLFAISVINFGLGCAIAAAMYLIGLPDAPLWGVMVMLLNFMPYVGATISLIVLSAVALLTFDEIGHALLVPAVFLACSIAEGQFITPTLVGRHLTMNPVAIFLALLFWGWLWGAAGLLIAVPMLVAFKIICAHVESLAAFGEFLGR
ncbi:MAG TPA: AI-2E family transporter [Burkholderiales bacterium]|nr:AI-2E family transporter [Burkholderiales bacterium]